LILQDKKEAILPIRTASFLFYFDKLFISFTTNALSSADLIFLSAGQGIALMPILKKLLGILAIMVIPTVIGTILEEIFKSTGKKWVKKYYKEQENK